MNLRIQLLVVTGVVILLMGCGGDVIDTVDPNVQRNIDIGAINDYIAEKGYNFEPGDTTPTGVRFVVVNEGAGDEINYGDIVDVYYAQRLTDGTLITTNIDTVDINNGTYDSLYSYPPIRFTHSETGWAIRNKLKGTSTIFTNGFFDGITAVLDNMNIGGNGEILVPSYLAYGTSTLSDYRNMVIVYQIHPVYKR